MSGVLKRWTGSQWLPVGGPTTDHGGLNGLTDDDHSAYPTTDHKRQAEPLSLQRSSKDANGIFTVVEYYRLDGTRASRSELTGGTSPEYTTRTFTEYDLAGTSAVRTTTYSLTYDGDSRLTTETVV